MATQGSQTGTRYGGRIIQAKIDLWVHLGHAVPDSEWVTFLHISVLFIPLGTGSIILSNIN